jgi:galactokinase
VVREFRKLGIALGGFEAVLAGDVPVAAGLSSSAAVEMAVGKGLLELNGASMSGPDLALLGQRAENRFVGVNCGIMDQFVSANARRDHALFLDCRDLSYELVPLSGEGIRIVICNTNVERRLTRSAYNERRAACEEGARLLAEATGRPIRALRDVTSADLEAHFDVLPAEIGRRCRHVVTENARALEGVALLKAGDMEGFGRQMAGSHESLRADYEVSGKELDLLVEIARGVPGILGARMTGAGFGGCTVNLARAGAVAPLVEAIERRYHAETGLRAEVYVCAAVNGAERVG